MSRWKRRKIKLLFKDSSMLRDYFLEDIPKSRAGKAKKLAIAEFQSLKGKYTSPDGIKRKVMILISALYLLFPTTTLAITINIGK